MERPPVKVICPHGHPPICRPSMSQQYCIALTPFADLIKVARHWDRDLKQTVLCTCEGGCHSRREDYFAAGLAKLPAEGMQFAVVTLQFTPANLSTLEIGMRSAGHDWETKGMGFTWIRRGKDPNSPAIVMFKQLHQVGAEHGFDLAAAILYHLRIATDFFSKTASESLAVTGAPAQLNGDQVIAPIRSRNDKPRVPKGSRG